MKMINFEAYHGTSYTRARSIIEAGEFAPVKTRDDHWLGHGSYFFREDQEQASIWAKNRYQEEPAVIGVNVEIPQERYLNLDSRAGVRFLIDHLKELKKQGLQIEGEDIKLKGPAIACLVFSAIDKELKWVIFKTFPVKSRRFDNDQNLKSLSFKHKGVLMSFGLQGPQVCVRNNEAIKNMNMEEGSEKKNVGKVSLGSKRREKISDDVFRWQS